MAVCYQHPNGKSMQQPTYFQSYIKFFGCAGCNDVVRVCDSFVMRSDKMVCTRLRFNTILKWMNRSARQCLERFKKMERRGRIDDGIRYMDEGGNEHANYVE